MFKGFSRVLGVYGCFEGLGCIKVHTKSVEKRVFSGSRVHKGVWNTLERSCSTCELAT